MAKLGQFAGWNSANNDSRKRLFPTTAGIQLLAAVSDEDVASFVLRIERVIDKLAPVLIYFRQNDAPCLAQGEPIRGALFAGLLRRNSAKRPLDATLKSRAMKV